MKDLSFDVELTWSATGRQGAGQIRTDDLVLELSGPKSMGGLGSGTNPEELSVCAASSCYAAALWPCCAARSFRVAPLAVAAAEPA